MAITSTYFGRTQDGKEVYSYLLESKAGVRVCVLEYGCVLKNIWVTDKNGTEQDVVLGYETIEEYENGTGFFGSFVGRVANRLKKAQFTADGVQYQLEPNEGENFLHGTLNRKVFQGKIQNDTLYLTAHSPDGENGFPGAMDITVAVTLTDEGSLVLDYIATTDKPTVFNATNHSYFNLEGAQSQSVYAQTLWLDADSITPVDAQTLPTGEIRSVVGTAFDFTAAKPIGQDINNQEEQLQLAHGYDHNFVINKEMGELGIFAKAYSDVTGIWLEGYTTQPGVQLYTGNFLANGKLNGKAGVPYENGAGFCLETQHYPCAPSYDHFPSIELSPEEEYHETTIYKFGVI